jgi:hypothetical protein
MIAALLAGCLASADASTTEGDSLFLLKSEHASMTIDPSHGGKILSLKYNDTEVLSQSRWPESFGSTFWTSPQKEWNWPPVPEYDKRPYSVVERSDSKLVIRSQVNDRLKFSIGKTFVAEGDHIAVSYTITNEGDATRSVAPWEITRVPNDDGLIFFDAPVEAITPAGLMDFKAEGGAVWYSTDETNQNRKVNADGHGWLAYLASPTGGGLLLIKQFDDLDASAPAPGEAEIQVYVNRGKSYIELESQGAYTTLAPGQELTWTVRWMLVPVKSGTKQAKLLKTVKKALKH